MPLDRRCRYSLKGYIVLFFVAILWAASIVYGDADVTKAQQAISNEQTIDNAQSIYLMQAQWRIIGGMFGLIQILVGYIYISGINSIKEANRKIFVMVEELEQAKLSKEDHDRLCRKDGRR